MLDEASQLSGSPSPSVVSKGALWGHLTHMWLQIEDLHEVDEVVFVLLSCWTAIAHKSKRVWASIVPPPCQQYHLLPGLVIPEPHPGQVNLHAHSHTVSPIACTLHSHIHRPLLYIFILYNCNSSTGLHVNVKLKNIIGHCMGSVMTAWGATIQPRRAPYVPYAPCGESHPLTFKDGIQKSGHLAWNNAPRDDCTLRPTAQQMVYRFVTHCSVGNYVAIAGQLSSSWQEIVHAHTCYQRQDSSWRGWTVALLVGLRRHWGWHGNCYTQLPTRLTVCKWVCICTWNAPSFHHCRAEVSLYIFS